MRARQTSYVFSRLYLLFHTIGVGKSELPSQNVGEGYVASSPSAVSLGSMKYQYFAYPECGSMHFT